MPLSTRSLFVVCLLAGLGCGEPMKKVRKTPMSSGGLATGGAVATGGAIGTGGAMATGGAMGTGGSPVVEPPAERDAAAADAAVPDAVVDAPVSPDAAPDTGAPDAAADVAAPGPDLAPDLSADHAPDTAPDLAADLAPPSPDLQPDSGPDTAPSALCTPSGPRPALKRTLIAGGLTRPIQIVGPPDETDTLWVLEHRTGNVKVIKSGAVTGTLAHVTVAAGAGRSTTEEGLYSIALHPDYASNHLFYLFYSADDDPDFSTTVDEFHKSGATASFVRNVYSRPSSYWFHNGGAIAFHPLDGKLYLSVGDNKDGGGYTYAQMPEGDWGRILALDLAGGGVTFHYGLRNPWRFSFDAQNGDLYIGDVGESGTNSENVFYSRAGSSKTNFGWVGTNTRPPALDQTDAGTPIIGGIVYRGTRMPGLCGFYVYGRNAGGPIKTLKVVNGQATMVADSAISTANLSSFGTDSAGELYYSELTAGTVYRIDPN